MTLDMPSCLSIANYIRYRDGIHAQDAEDFRHDVVVEMIERAQRNGGGLSDKEMWRAARCVRNRYRRAYCKSPLSLNAPIRGTEEPIELQETLAGKDVDLDAWVDARTHLEQLPFEIRRIARKLEKGDPLTRSQQAQLVRFRQDGKPNPHAIYMVNRYRDRRSRGLCVRCGEESDGFARCPRCRETFRAGQKRYRRRKGQAWLQTMRAHWRKQGRCYRCGRVPEPGRSKCSYHLAKDRENLRRWKEKRAINENGGESMENLKAIIEENGKDWAIAAIVDGSIGYYDPEGARLVLDDYLRGATKCWSERCLACFGADLEKMLLHDVQCFLYLEHHQPERAAGIIAFCHEWAKLTGPDATTIGLLYPTM